MDTDAENWALSMGFERCAHPPHQATLFKPSKEAVGKKRLIRTKPTQASHKSDAFCSVAGSCGFLFQTIQPWFASKTLAMIPNEECRQRVTSEKHDLSFENGSLRKHFSFLDGKFFVSLFS